MKAVLGDLVVVAHSHHGLPYTRTWGFEEFAGTRYEKIQRNTPLAVWRQAEVGLLENTKPSPVFVHQYREAVKTMAELLELHRTDRSSPDEAAGYEVGAGPAPDGERLAAKAEDPAVSE